MAPKDSVPALNLTDDSRLALLNPPAIQRGVGYRMRFALHAAVLAPNVHNTQPWRFRFSDGVDPHMDLLMDVERELTELDPAHRQLIISCGAALAAYQIGLLGCGLLPHIETFPPEARSTCLARVRVTDLDVPDAHARELWPLLIRRRSYRGPMNAQTFEQPIREHLIEAAAPTGLLDFVPGDLWRNVEQIIAEATIELGESTDVNGELQTWTRLSERSRDGVPAANWQRTSEQTAMAPVVQRDFAQDRPLPEGDPDRVVEDRPQLAVLFSRGDTAADWLDSGSALLRVSLTAQRLGLALGYVNQPTEVAGLRVRLAAVLRPTKPDFQVPQLVIRLGYPSVSLPPATPRRLVRDVLSS